MRKIIGLALLAPIIIGVARAQMQVLSIAARNQLYTFGQRQTSARPATIS